MSTRIPYLTRAFLISLSLFLSSGLLAQDKKAKAKDFGSSLKRIKSEEKKAQSRSIPSPVPNRTPTTLRS
jgi:hypothetical protein